jgi:hypothetical protein
MPTRIFLGLCALLALANGASAAVWAWGCQAQVGDQQIIFNRFSLVVVDTKVKMGDVRKLRVEKIELPAAAPPHTDYEPDDVNGGFEDVMVFKRTGGAGHKVTLTQKSSKQTSHKHKLVCGRDEDTDTYRKVYSLQRDDEPARDITMQCMEYQLSTRGGRPGCD